MRRPNRPPTTRPPQQYTTVTIVRDTGAEMKHQDLLVAKAETDILTATEKAINPHLEIEAEVAVVHHTLEDHRAELSFLKDYPWI